MPLQDRKWNIEQCNRCHQCKVSPTPRSQRFSAVCPAIEYGQFHAYSGSGKLITGYALMEGRAQYTAEALESITTCSMCGACDTACRTLQGDVVAPMDTLYELRAKLFADGELPAAQSALLDNIAAHGNPYGSPRAERVAWAAGLGLVDASRGKVEVLLHVGCANTFDESQWPGMRAVVQKLAAAAVSLGTLGEQEAHAGALPYELGHHELARKCADRFVAQLRACEASTLVTFDAASLSAFRNFYPRLGVALAPVRVLHITEFLEEITRTGGWPAPAARDELVTYHDPCRLGRLAERYVPWHGEWTTVMNGLRVAVPPTPERFGLGGVYDAPRRLLQNVPGTRLVEMERRRELSYCCGAGGGGLEAHPEFADQAARHRLDEALATGATTLVSSCATCTRHLQSTAKRHGIHIRVTDLVSYVTAATADITSDATEEHAG